MSSGPELHRAHAESITVREDVRSAAWIYLALLGGAADKLGEAIG